MTSDLQVYVCCVCININSSAIIKKVKNMFWPSTNCVVAIVSVAAALSVFTTTVAVVAEKFNDDYYDSRGKNFFCCVRAFVCCTHLCAANNLYGFF